MKEGRSALAAGHAQASAMRPEKRRQTKARAGHRATTASIDRMPALSEEHEAARGGASSAGAAGRRADPHTIATLRRGKTADAGRRAAG
jgi:hypothetical protein